MIKILFYVVLLLAFITVFAARAEEPEPNPVQQVVIDANDFITDVYKVQKKFFGDGPWNGIMPDNVKLYVKPDWDIDKVIDGGEVGFRITF